MCAEARGVSRRKFVVTTYERSAGPSPGLARHTLASERVARRAFMNPKTRSGACRPFQAAAFLKLSRSSQERGVLAPQATQFVAFGPRHASLPDPWRWCPRNRGNSPSANA